MSLRDGYRLRRSIPSWQALLYGTLFLIGVYTLWWYVTLGEEHERILKYHALPSPAETFGKLHALWFEDALLRNTVLTLQRVTLGFGLAVLVGIPIGILCGCFSAVHAFFQPVILFGRNIPIAALVGLTFALFGIGESNRIMFIFIACIAFIISDTARAIDDISSQYVDTAHTLGARTWQVVLKVLVPLALPDVFNSLRMLFGLAFGYIMLAETVVPDSGLGGLGGILNTSQSRAGNLEYIYLIVLLIPFVAFGIDRMLFWVQRELFPFRYGGSGVLWLAWRGLCNLWEDFLFLIVKPGTLPQEKQS